MVTPWEVPDLEIRERHHQHKKMSTTPSWEVSELEIRQQPLSMLRNIDGGPPRGANGDPGAPTINIKNIDDGPS
jgi:hypothetical protein